MKYLPAVLLLVLVGAFSGWAGYRIGKGDAPAPEIVSAAPAVRMPDGALMAERKPADKPLQAPHALPRGSKEERRISATVKPAGENCAPVTVVASLVQADGGKRVVISSPDGEVVSAIDTPIATALIQPAPHLWAAGPSYDPFGKRFGMWVERDLGRIRVGVDINQIPDSYELRARIGWTF